MDKEFKKLLDRNIKGNWTYSYKKNDFSLSFKDTYLLKLHVNLEDSSRKARLCFYNKMYESWNKFNDKEYIAAHRTKTIKKKDLYYFDFEDEEKLQEDADAIENKLFQLSSELYVSDEQEYYA